MSDLDEPEVIQSDILTLYEAGLAAGFNLNEVEKLTQQQHNRNLAVYTRSNQKEGVLSYRHKKELDNKTNVPKKK